MAVITSKTKLSGAYLGESAALNIVNEEITILSGAGVLDPGTVLGQVAEGGAATVVTAAGAGNTGNGVFAATPTADAGAPAGTYSVQIIEPAAAAGTFRVERPDGSLDGTGNVGVAYNGTINFTLNDGAVDFVAGDSFSVTVSWSSTTKYAAHDPAAVDGRETAAAILFHEVDATASDQKSVATVRGPATIFEPYLTFKTGISAADKTAAKEALRAKGMAVLPQHV